MEKQRLSKVLASAGIASRRGAEELIFSGRVKVNGEITLLPQTMVSLGEDKIFVDGQPVEKKETKFYYLLNKPAGYSCAVERPHPTTKLAIDLFENKTGLVVVGSLDREATGLLIVTNDRHFAQTIVHPKAKLDKEYVIKVNEEITHDHLCAISHGSLINGVYIRPISVKKVRRGTMKIVVADGKKGEVRQLIEAIDLNIREIKRIRYGHFHLGNLSEGAFREMTPAERDQVEL